MNNGRGVGGIKFTKDINYLTDLLTNIIMHAGQSVCTVCTYSLSGQIRQNALFSGLPQT